MDATRADLAAPFHDLVVVDLATLNAAPQIATFFGDLGARVVKVEPPRGDPLRRLVDADGVALQWALANRNKACVTCDPTRPAGRALLDRLLARTDVLVTAYAADRLARFGLDAATLRAAYPRLVAVNLTTFGTAGPWRDHPGSGTLAEAAGGLAHLTGFADGPPVLAPVGLGDHLGVLHGIIAALTGLVARGNRGNGAGFDVAMTDAILTLVGQRLAQVARSGVDPGRHGNRFPTVAPRNAYPTADGRWVAITAGTDDLAHRLLAAVGRPELAADPRFATNRARIEHVDALEAVIGGWIAARPAAEVVEALRAARVSAAVIDDLAAVRTNAHFAARGVFAHIDDPALGDVLVTPWLPGAGSVHHLGRPLGADNDAVWAGWLGVSAAELATLRADAIV